MKELEHYYAVIMAGGGGTRLWPLSREAHPKQMLRLLGDRSLFQTSVERLQGVFPAERVYVVTVEDQAEQLHAQCPDIPEDNYLLEPLPRGTASVVGLAAVALIQKDPQATMAVLTADHYIGNEDRFRDLLRAAYDVAQDDYLVTLGIEPTFPATGYGYIQRGEQIGADRNLKVFRVTRFREKPDESQAEEMFKAGDHAWNSGMFVWRVERIMQEFSGQMPELAATLEKIAQAWDSPEREEVLERLWPEIEVETIDYGIMEAAQRVAVIPAEGLNWSDVGSWDSLFEVLPSDASGNIVMGGHHVGLDTQDSLVYVDQQRRLIVTIGVQDLVVVDTDDVLLICRKDQAQKVRQVVKQLREEDPNYV
ncbi:MAG TPA: mannose-1-phosphate guanylyltransferase [Anaerolineales bacterium]|jgi:mannose-1-phosphate guanylyltransferase|nr:mannose-1-phosphate guanylyltransferase [Anaerolineales bacterium]